jgi:hypothetical protein
MQQMSVSIEALLQILLQRDYRLPQPLVTGRPRRRPVHKTEEISSIVLVTYLNNAFCQPELER